MIVVLSCPFENTLAPEIIGRLFLYYFCEWKWLKIIYWGSKYVGFTLSLCNKPEGGKLLK